MSLTFKENLVYILAALLLTGFLPACAQQTSLAQSVEEPASPSAQPTEAIPTPVLADPTQPAPAGLFNENGLAVQIDPALASGGSLEQVPPVSGTSDSPYWLAAPAFRQVTLNGYPVANHAFTAQIFVYPVDEFKAANPAAAEIITNLQTMIGAPKEIDPLPFLPLINAKPIIHPQFQVLSFQNGQGFRCLTQLSQGITPINNLELIYTYQGLTQDGKYYVAAVLPVTHSSLPADGKMAGKELEDLASSYTQTLSAVTESLNQQSASSFTPDLTRLDAMLSSLEIQ